MSAYKTLKKFTDNIPNEDSCHVLDNMIVISDGAGGCGVFASDWSKYLVENMVKRPESQPITSFEQLDEWIGTIWEPFYNEYGKKAQEYDDIFQTKFDQEGSFATLAVVWRTSANFCQWMTYGDSVIFHYSKSKNIFEHSFTKLSDFSKAPFLISCKDPLHPQGFKSGTFNLTEDSVVFAASDALSQYILMSYYVEHEDVYKEEIDEIKQSYTMDAQMLNLAEKDKQAYCFDFLIDKIQDITRNQKDFDDFVKELYKRGVLEMDDYTLAILKYDKE